MGFFRYKSPGAMTFQNVEVHGLAPEEIVGVDHTLYAVLHCQLTSATCKPLAKQVHPKIHNDSIN
jgi:hypothetical protein